MRPERSPGNFAVRIIDGQPQFCVYDQNGTELCRPLSPRDTTQPAD
jgi:hypothetical protein